MRERGRRSPLIKDVFKVLYAGLWRCIDTVMKPHIYKDTHSESRRLRNPTFNLLREHSSTIDQQAAMLQVKLPAMGKLLFEYRNLTISSY